MEKSFFKQMGGTYIQIGDYLLPNLTLPEEEQKTIGIWGQLHLWYIKQHKRLFYANLLTSCELNSYLADIDEQAEDMFSRIVNEMVKKQGVTEQLKATDQMAWVGKMNAIRNAATEIINTYLIYK